MSAWHTELPFASAYLAHTWFFGSFDNLDPPRKWGDDESNINYLSEGGLCADIDTAGKEIADYTQTNVSDGPLKLQYMSRRWPHASFYAQTSQSNP